MVIPAGIYTFDVEEDRKREAERERSGGERFNMSETGAPDLGLTTDTPDQQELRNRAVHEAAVQAADEAAGVTPGADEVERLKKIIGDQGNEIGELRRTAEKATVLEGQVQAMQEQWNQAQRTQQQAQYNPQQGQQSLIDAIPDEGFYDAATMRRYYKEQEQKQAQFNQQLVGALQQELGEVEYRSTRTASGISDQQERALLQEFPELAGLRGADKAQAIAKIAKLSQSRNDAPQMAADEAARLAARRSSYTEPTDGVSREASDANLEPATEKLLRDYRAGKIKNSQESAKALRKLGIMNYDFNGLRY
jgi:hypothetical protein